MSSPGGDDRIVFSPDELRLMIGYLATIDPEDAVSPVFQEVLFKCRMLVDPEDEHGYQHVGRFTITGIGSSRPKKRWRWRR